MTVWYYAVGQEREGPVSEDKIRDLITGGTITRDAYIWRDGMADWEIVGTHPEISDAFVTPPPIAGVTPPPLPSRSQRTEPAQAPSEPVQPEPVSAPRLRAWPRFWARMFDLLLIAPLLSTGIVAASVLYAPHLYMMFVTYEFLWGFIITPLVGFVLAMLMALFGNTPGKAILGVRVPVPPQANRFLFYVKRELKVWFWAFALGMPVVFLITFAAQYWRLATGRPAVYDQRNPPVIANPGKLRLTLGIALVAILFTANAVWWRVQEKAEVDRTATQYWVNPVTGNTATIKKYWERLPDDPEIQNAFIFVARHLLMEGLFSHLELPAENVDPRLYAAFYAARLKNVTLTSDWEPVVINRVRGFRSNGVSIKDANQLVEVTVVVDGRDAWRLVMFTEGGSNLQTSEREAFVHELFGTTR
ncbi:RDD family protein [uncultured Agrobacterium sp.]|uniref:RDD family protein n=1 Tax=uncultured Agrobacterium sp. TaxID=157277 RepID=UPI0025DD5A8D|nr:RDD family protein [uncultured Agrobacterium sp.]